MILSTHDACSNGLEFVGINALSQEVMGETKCVAMFKEMYGSEPAVFADLWWDLSTTDIAEARLTATENTVSGLKKLLMACCYLFGYPRNSTWLRALFFPVAEKETYGERLWHWIHKVSLLLPQKIYFLPEWEDPEIDSEIFILGVDGTDCKTWERKHPTLPMDPKQYSQKFKHAGLKYEIGVATFHDRICWVNGPFPASLNDITIFRNYGLKDRIPDGKVVVADRGYQTSRRDEVDKLATPKLNDNRDQHKFESQIGCQPETVLFS